MMYDLFSVFLIYFIDLLGHGPLVAVLSESRQKGLRAACGRSIVRQRLQQNRNCQRNQLCKHAGADARLMGQRIDGSI